MNIIHDFFGTIESLMKDGVLTDEWFNIESNASTEAKSYPKASTSVQKNSSTKQYQRTIGHHATR